ncbi:hypothetical protein [Micromonospora endolithica]|uniref:Uncharacterized protein n=1 Tax=Micromonospora endolithica TaxID=230091 RepID=A0A3A9ZSH4_9ACTN|nr:hypothetical protein [Micromonospora endolithica]RKN50914.1 hypothetical protein D7223_03980 [Micromonospora endolithica]TWJ20313.1 hypothetical protein JD76_00411 [Micromonospora endolithica]
MSEDRHTGTNDLERRYRRLLRAYPGDYRRERGDEIVGTYLEVAGPDRRRPSPADAADLVRGGLRQRLRAVGAPDLAPGVRLAALLAFLTATPLAAAWMVLEQHTPPAAGPLTAAWLAQGQHTPPAVWNAPYVGPFLSLGVGVWLVWLLAVLPLALGSVRWTRRLTGAAVLATVAVLPLAALTGLPRPPLFVLLPQVALGLVALALPERLPTAARLLPLVAVGAAAVAAPNLLPRAEDFYVSYYGWTASQILPWAAAALLVTVLLIGVGLAVRGDLRAGWAGVVLATPLGLMSLHVFAGAVDGVLHGAPRPGWSALAGTAVAVTVLGPALLPATIALRRRVTARLATPTAGRCPTCGTAR